MKPEYSFFKNFSYAIEGIVDMFKSETSFKIEVFIFVIALFFTYSIDISLSHKAMLIASGLLVLMTECINSSLERCVDLVTEDWHILAKRAKDAGAAAVFFSILIALIIWSSVIYVDFIE